MGNSFFLKISRENKWYFQNHVFCANKFDIFPFFFKKDDNENNKINWFQQNKKGTLCNHSVMHIFQISAWT